MRRSLVAQVGGYAPQQRYAVEYDLFWRLAQHAEIANLPQFLAAHRVSAGQTSQTQAQIQQAEVTLWQWALYRGYLGVRATPDAVQAHYAANRGLALADAAQVSAAADLLEALQQAYLVRVQPDARAARLIEEEVAWKLFAFALVNQGRSAALTADLQERALRHDPALMSRPRVRARRLDSLAE
jgi:hypothetical protein